MISAAKPASVRAMLNPAAGLIAVITKTRACVFNAVAAAVALAAPKPALARIKFIAFCLAYTELFPARAAKLASTIAPAAPSVLVNTTILPFARLVTTAAFRPLFKIIACTVV